MTRRRAACDRDWQRFTPLQRLARFGFYLFAVAALVVSLRTIEVIPEFLYDAPEQMADLFAPDVAAGLVLYRTDAARALIETLHIATLGTILAIVMAVPVGAAGGAQHHAESRRSTCSPNSSS